MLLFNYIISLNKKIMIDFNTSNVTIQPNNIKDNIEFNKFQYI